MFGSYIAEAVGSFVFFAIVLTKGDPVMIAVGLLIGMLIASIASPGYLNPCITAMFYMQGKISGDVSIALIAAEIIGAILAVQWFSYFSSMSNADKMFFYTK